MTSLQDVYRRCESQHRIRAAEDANLIKTFIPDINASMEAVQPLKDASSSNSPSYSTDGCGNGGAGPGGRVDGSSSSSSSSTSAQRFDRLYADAKQRQDAKNQALKAKVKVKAKQKRAKGERQ
jgi:hypothetical protein